VQPILSLDGMCRIEKVIPSQQRARRGFSAESGRGPCVTAVPLRVIRDSLCSSHSTIKIKPEVDERIHRIARAEFCRARHGDVLTQNTVACGYSLSIR